MHRSFYLFALFLNVALSITALTEAWLFFTVGKFLHYAQAYPRWILAGAFLSAFEAIVLLKYLRIKKYRAAFRNGIPYYISLVFILLLNYSLLTFGVGTQLAIPMQILTLVLQVVYGATLLATTSGWLRITGGYSALLSLFSFVLVSMIASGKFISFHLIIEKIEGPLLWAAVLIPCFLAINFYREWRRDSVVSEQSDPIVLVLSFPIVAAITLFMILTFGSDGMSMKKWLPEMETLQKKIAEPFEARVYVNADGDSLKYRLLKPLNFDPSKSYPIVVCLHGSSGTGNDNFSQVGSSLFPEFMSREANLEKYQAFLFVPQCTFGTSWGGVHPLPGVDQIVFEAMASLENELPIDTRRRYVMGISLGGYGTWHFIESRPDVFAAAIPICGVGDPDRAANCVNTPVWAFHGAHDERVPVSGSRDMISAMKKAGGHPHYTEYPDATHDIGKLVCETPGLLDWLFAQRLGSPDSTQIQ